MTDYLAPRRLDRALEALASGRTSVLAGGTDLMIALRHTRRTGQPLPETLLDVTNIPDLTRLDAEAETPYIGAAVTYRRLEADPAVAAAYPMLAQAASMVGSAQIRQTATLGGNVGTGSPAGDGVCALTALGARVELASVEGRRRVPLTDLITAPNRTALKADELIVGFYLDRLAPRAAQRFVKVGRRQAVAVARLNLALALDRDRSEIRVVLGSCFPSPRRLSAVEELIGRGEPGPELWAEAGRMTSGEFVNVCGLRSSAQYKIPAIERVMAAELARTWAEAEAWA